MNDVASAVPRQPDAPSARPASRQAVAWRDLGRVFAVQGPGRVTSVVRTQAGSLTCDCRAPGCIHVDTIRNVLLHRAAHAPPPAGVLLAGERADGLQVDVRQRPGATVVTLITGDRRFELRPSQLATVVRLLDRVGQRIGVLRR